MNNGKILYIDTEKDILNIAAGFFEDQNISVDTCADFAEARNLARKHHYEMIITDSKRASGNGSQLRLLRDELNYKGKLVLLSSRENVALDDLNTCHVVIYKPIPFAAVVLTIKEILVA